MFETLHNNGLTLREEKCSLSKPEVKWFRNIYSHKGMSPDPDKCITIKNWPEPTMIAEVKSFLQTAQFNAKFLQRNMENNSIQNLQSLLAETRERDDKEEQ